MDVLRPGRIHRLIKIQRKLPKKGGGKMKASEVLQKLFKGTQVVATVIPSGVCIDPNSDYCDRRGPRCDSVDCVDVCF